MGQIDTQSRALAEENARKIGSELHNLHARLQEIPVHFRGFWTHVGEVNALFKEMKPLRRDVREELWERFGAICAEAKEKKEEQRRQWESRSAVSKNKRSLVEGKIHEAHGYAKGGRTAGDLAKGRELLNEALTWMKNGWSGFNAPTQLFAFDDGKMLKTDHDACWERWREANAALQDRREELGNYHFEHFEGEAEDAIGVAEYDPKRAKEKVKEIQKSMHGKIMTTEQFTEVRRLLDKAWERATGVQKKRHEEWEDLQLDNIHKKKELIDKMEGDIDGIRDQIEHCRNIEAGARTEEHAEEVRRWIDEKNGWIDSKREFIRKLETQIRELESKLRN